MAPGTAGRQRHFDEDQRLVHELGMEEGEAAPVRRLETVAQILPGADLMHRLIADDLLENIGGRRPIDRPQHQKARIEPGGEEMGEVGIDALELPILLHGAQQLLAHAHQRRRAARREVEPSDELLATRLGGGMQIEHRLAGRVRAIGLDRQQPGVDGRSRTRRRGGAGRRGAPRARAPRSRPRIALASATPEASPRPESSASQSSARSLSLSARCGPRPRRRRERPRSAMLARRSPKKVSLMAAIPQERPAEASLGRPTMRGLEYIAP